MAYTFPASLHPLRDWLAAQGLDEQSLKTERQTAFMAQRLAGTRFKFPPKGQSCILVLQKIQAAAQIRITEGIASTATQSKGSKRGRPQVEITPPAGLVIYCDGACDPNPGAGGWGFVVYRDGVEIHTECGGDPVATNNTMELTGALMALRWFAARGVIEPVRLLCDSQYVVRGCNEWRHGWKKKGWKRGPQKELANADLWRELDEALTLVPITLEWCKGHAGILGNERADELSLIGREKALETVPAGNGSLIEQQLAYEVV
ncbi:ribonuclease H [Chelativorans sp. J32]|uniref:ribonuclease H family protein n=1 Tax=Chelativorans sp. J32 TaxID=935840 RepID=UPI0004B9EC78|nr:ribonuclease H [Chelativorans sp. J32]